MSKAQDEQPIAQPTQEKHRELGFGSRLFRKRIRLINRDGSFNVRKHGRSWWRPYDFYQALLTMSWMRFTGLVLLVYLSANLVFSLLYLAVGLDNLAGAFGATPMMKFLDAFFFSAQTITTLGYGRISPVGTSASTIAAVESLVGLLGFALATGLLYGRFSRPEARIAFSENMLVAPYKDITGLMFRIANERSSQLIEVEVQVVMSWADQNEKKRRFQALELELKKVNFLSLSWTIVHPIDAESPLQDVSPSELEAMDAEFIVLIKGFDDGFSSTVYQRSSYKFWEVVFDAKFRPMIESAEDMLVIDLQQLSDFEGIGAG